MLTILLGPDDFGKRQHVRAAAEKSKAAVGVFYFPDPDVQVRQLAGGDLFSGPLVYALVGAVAASAIGPEEAAALSRGSNQVFCLEEKLDRRKDQVKQLLKVPGVTVSEFPLPHGSELNRWLKTRAGELKVSLEPQAVEALAVRLGRDEFTETRAGGRVISVTETYSLWQADSELKKLAAYSGGRTVTAEDVERLVPENLVADTLKLANAVADRQRGLAFSLVDRFLSEGQASDEKARIIQLNALLAEQFRNVLAVQDFAARRVPEQEVLKVTGWRSGRLFVLRKVASRFTVERVRELLDKLQHLDLELKSSSMPPRVLLDMILVRLLA